MSRDKSAPHPDRVFHHPDPIRTSATEWVFMLAVTVAVLVGLPVGIGVVFHYLVPALGKLVVH